MSYDQHILEFHIELSRLSAFAKGKFAKEALLNLPVLTNEMRLQLLWDNVDSMQTMHTTLGQLPLREGYEIKDLIQLLSKGHIADLDEMIQIKRLIELSEDVYAYYIELRKINDNTPFFKQYELPRLKHLHHMFQDVFDDQEAIKDDASSQLKTIRKKLSVIDQKYQQSLQQALKSYESYLNDTVIVAKNDALCLSVSDTYKNKVKGIVMDMSQSKQTIYIEPHQASLIRQEKSQLKQEEKQEIYKILVYLTEQIRHDVIIIDGLIDVLRIYDIFQAKARYATSLQAVKPHISYEKIELIQARHPQLKEQAIPINITFSKKSQALFITGPNTGGKTVSLKTVGLLQLMAQSGLFIPASEKSSVMLFEHVFADIGDAQSITHNLSTFSGHLVKHINFLNQVNEKTLLLIDEIGSGTDPQEGVALAKSMLQTYANNGAMMMVTTHYQALKEYALKQQFELASVAFDETTLSPLYHVIPGISGQSHAFDIAKRLGLPVDVLNQAKKFYDDSQSDTEKLLRALEQKELELNHIKDELDIKTKTVEQNNQKLEVEKEAFEQYKKHAIHQSIEIETKKLQQKIQDVEDMLKTLKTTDLSLPITSKMKGQLKTITSEKVSKTLSFEVGDSVMIDSYGQIGTIMSIKNNKYDVKLGHFHLTFSKDELSKTEEQPKPKPIKRETYISKPKSDYIYELDLRGFRFEEVKPALEKAIDQAVMSNQETLSVIHGFGTGAVKKAVHDYIKNHPNIKSHRYGKEGEGLNGVTILTLK